MESLESAERMKKDLEDRLTGAYREVNIVFVVCVWGGGRGGGCFIVHGRIRIEVHGCSTVKPV